MPTILSIQVGLPQTRGIENATDPMQRPWTSAFYKSPVESVFMSKTSLEGDAQADLKYHGGPDRIALVYAAKHYEYWRQISPERDWIHGGFGENFTVTELDETQVCIGDIFVIGKVRVQVTQPRKPCWKLARRWGIKTLSAQAQELAYIGWYLRVLEEGEVATGTEMELQERLNPMWTIARANDVMHKDVHNWALAAELADCVGLGEKWKAQLHNRVAQKETVDSRDRLIGPNE